MKKIFFLLTFLAFLTYFSQTIDDNPIVAGFSLNQSFNEKDMPNLLKSKELLTEPARKYYEICERNGEPKANLIDESHLKKYTNYVTYTANLMEDENVDNSRFTRYYDNIYAVTLRYNNPYAYYKDKSFPKDKENLAQVSILLYSNSTGWNANHFEKTLNNFKIKFGEPTLVNKSQSGAIDWIWSGKKNVLIFSYLFENSLNKPMMRIEFMTKKFYNQFY